ncbi:MAG: pyridoxal phosphate-dependent aminotransferase, partial [Acidobacteriaceae bacterium]|nr:pyridoxal phosphate-dependent aminotransferase [Acidobacteriaceae bacterium]MBV8572989.1 pyridoxal phosphate-dependent aminotransferase [Acidobacteriaceae bacterium]
MPQVLPSEQAVDLLRRGYSRRSFGRIATLLTAGAALPFYNEPALAQLSRVRNIPADATKIDANENPMGPCPEAADAIHNVIRHGGRYMYAYTDELAQTMAEIEQVKFSYKAEESYIQIYAGSSAPLHQAVLAFTSKDRPLVTADPGYEAGPRAAKFIGAEVVNVPLRKGTWDHDVRGMLAAAPNAGLFYICNPNNPTGTLTSRADIEYLVANKPKGSVVMIDEAYIHLAKNAVPCTDMAAAGKDVVVLRTFSKIYGMAGLRAGAAIARPDLLGRISGFSAGAMPITAMVGATASLKVKTLVPDRRKTIGDTREEVFTWLSARNVEFVPSETNCFMVNVKRPGREFWTAMTAQKVYVGRSWPVWPDWVRVTVGTPADMAKFKDAFLKCYNA